LAPFTSPSPCASLSGLGELKYDEKFYSAVSWPEEKDKSLRGKTVPKGLTTEKYFSCPAGKASPSPEAWPWLLDVQLEHSPRELHRQGRDGARTGSWMDRQPPCIRHAHVLVTICLALCPRRQSLNPGAGTKSINVLRINKTK